MKTMTLYPLFVALVLCPSISLAASSASFPAREQRKVGDFVITYSTGDEAYADALVRQLPDFRVPPVGADVAGIPALADLKQRREEILRRVATILALPEPQLEAVEMHCVRGARSRTAQIAS